MMHADSPGEGTIRILRPVVKDLRMLHDINSLTDKSTHRMFFQLPRILAVRASIFLAKQHT